MAILAGAVFWALLLVRQVLLLVYVSALLAVGFGPLVRLIERQRVVPIGTRLPRWAAILVLYVTILGTLAALGAVVVPPLVRQAREFVTHLPQILDQVQGWLLEHGVLTQPLTLGDVMQQVPTGTDAVGAVVATIWSVVGGLFGVVTILILTFYLLVDSASIFEGFVRLFARSRRARVRDVAQEITSRVSAWLNGQLMLAAIVGSIIAVGLGLLGVPYFYVLALLAGVGEFIPYVGPFLAAIPALAVAATVSWKLAVGVAILYFATQQLENHVLVPKIMQHQVGLSPSAVIVALLVGAGLLGVVGAILAVPTAAILVVVLQELLNHDDDAPA
jgi:predicted PurR-regulated permease PerM